jgi:hypothetical protein
VRRREFFDPRDPTEREVFLNADGNDIRVELTEHLERVPTTDDVDVERGSPTPVSYRDEEDLDGQPIEVDGPTTSGGSDDDDDDDEVIIEETDGGRSTDERADGGDHEADSGGSDGSERKEGGGDERKSTEEGVAGGAGESSDDRGS